MAFPTLLVALGIFTVASSALMFISKRLLHAVLFLALAAVGSSLLFLYVSQTLVAFLQLLVFVGSLSTYMLVAVASEEKKIDGLGVIKFLIAAVAVASVLSYLVYGVAGVQANDNSFSLYAEMAFSQYAAFLFASVFVLFSATIGSIVIMRRLSKLVF